MKPFIWATLIIGLSLISYAYSGVNKQFYTFAPEIEVTGPVAGLLTPEEYHQGIFRIILEEAHEMARDYLEYHDYQGYWNFIFGAFVVPFHESGNMHFRLVDNVRGSCIYNSNNGKILSHSSSYKNIFYRNFKSKGSQTFPNCNQFYDTTHLTQLLHGGDGSDLGIMQVNMKWHEKDFVGQGLYKSTRESIKYGLTLYRKGFETIYRRRYRYPCIFQKKRIIQRKFVHAIWSGIYNSGRAEASCRWTKKDNEWQKNDDNFIKSIKRFYSLRDEAKRAKLYPLPELEAQLLTDIINKSYNAIEFPEVILNYLNIPLEPSMFR